MKVWKERPTKVEKGLERLAGAGVLIISGALTYVGLSPIIYAKDPEDNPLYKIVNPSTLDEVTLLSAMSLFLLTPIALTGVSIGASLVRYGLDGLPERD